VIEEIISSAVKEDVTIFYEDDFVSN